ncbi:MFS transporter [Rhodococcus sp. NCIMB 12038]|uniref:MFS transporter n=1 Tax=Rhodococcus sp. NCIMB 12038 TaxID=933800 RepID=UPI0015C6646D|nr:MFS transporter [Rhodococcus sp. NCIMB 12038]
MPPPPAHKRVRAAEADANRCDGWPTVPLATGCPQDNLELVNQGATVSQTIDQQSSRHDPELSEWRSGRRALLGSSLGFGAGAGLFLLTFSLFVKPIKEATGWSTTTILIVPVVQLVWGLAFPVVGRLITRFGARSVATFGVIATAALLILVYLVPFNLAVYYGFAALISIVGSLAWHSPYVTALSTWFHKNSGRALSIALSGGGASMTIIAVPLVSSAIYSYGFKTGYLVLAAFMLLVALPATVFLVRQRPEPDTTVNVNAAGIDVEGPTPPKAVQQVVSPRRTFRFWALAVSIGVASLGAAGFVANLAAIMLEAGLSVKLATGTLSIFFVFTAIGGFVNGLLLDRVRPFLVPAVVLSFSASGAFVIGFANSSFPTAVVVLAAGLIGMCSGTQAELPAFFMLRKYGRTHFRETYNTTMMTVVVFATCSPFIFGLIRDFTGSYFSACMFSGSALLLSVTGMVLFGRDRDHEIAA